MKLLMISVLVAISGAPPAETWGPEIVWTPSEAALRAMMQSCHSGGPEKYVNCWVAEMPAKGASPQAIAFLKATENSGYARSFAEMGRIDVAFTTRPFAANENWGCVLLNGTPDIVDVDDPALLPAEAWKKAAGYSDLAKKYPNLIVFPGDRSGMNSIRTETRGGAQKFSVPYKLMDGCHACPVVGAGWASFEFSASGKFQRAQAVKVDPRKSK